MTWYPLEIDVMGRTELDEATPDLDTGGDFLRARSGTSLPDNHATAITYGRTSCDYFEGGTFCRWLESNSVLVLAQQSTVTGS
jgi:hypothetical protein